MVIPRRVTVAMALVLLAAACGGAGASQGPPELSWYVFDEPSGSFDQAAKRCSTDRYTVKVELLPTDANQQREQLVRRLAAGDSAIDLIGMDVIWTAEFAQAGWILPFEEQTARKASEGRLRPAVESATFDDRLWGAPFTSNTQLLWYRTDRVQEPPKTWDQMLRRANEVGQGGDIAAQGQRYEGLTVFFLTLLSSAGGKVLKGDGEGAEQEVALEEEPTRAALEIMQRYATSAAAPPTLSTMIEDDARLHFQAGDSTFMVNYPFVFPAITEEAPDVAKQIQWTRWPSVEQGRESRVVLGGLNIGVGAFTQHSDVAFDAAACIASEENQLAAATEGGLPPTILSLYEDQQLRKTYPFADDLKAALQDAALRPVSPVYFDISLAIARTLHPMRDIDPDGDVEILRDTINAALEARGLM